MHPQTPARPPARARGRSKPVIESPSLSVTSRFRPQYLLLPRDMEFERTREGERAPYGEKRRGNLHVVSPLQTGSASALTRPTHRMFWERNPADLRLLRRHEMRRSGSFARKEASARCHGRLCLGVNTDWSISALTLCRNQFTNPTEQYCVSESGRDQSGSTFHLLCFFNFLRGAHG